MIRGLVFLIFFSCNTMAAQLFNVSYANGMLLIKTAPQNHSYPQASLQMLTPGAQFSSTDCDSVIDQRCLFSVSNTKEKLISIQTSSGFNQVQLCLNGVGKLSCQNYTINVSNTNITVGSVTVNSILNPLIYTSTNSTSSWSAPNLPDMPLGSTSVKLGAVSCSTNRCIAAGYSDLSALFYVSSDGGQTWSQPIQVSNPSGASSTEINGLSCTESGHCVAVGKTEISGEDTPLTIVSFDSGDTWSISPHPPISPTESGSTQLWSVSCLSSGQYCVAVGWGVENGENIPLSYTSRDAGLTWSSAVTLNLPTSMYSGVLYGVSCAAQTPHCVTVGYVQQASSDSTAFPLSYYSNDGGLSWEPVLPEVSDMSENSQLKSVSCAANGARCVAVGALEAQSGDDYNLVYTTVNGGRSWSAPITPAGPSDSASNKLNAVHCTPTAGMCVSVGHGVNSTGDNLPYSCSSLDGGLSWSDVVLMTTEAGTTNSDLFSVSGG